MNRILCVAAASICLGTLAEEVVVQDFVEKNGVLVPRVQIVNKGAVQTADQVRAEKAAGESQAPAGTNPNAGQTPPAQPGNNVAAPKPGETPPAPVDPDAPPPPPTAAEANSAFREAAMREERNRLQQEYVDGERKKKAGALRAIGIETDWQKHTLTELTDWERRVLKARELNAAGVKVDWRTATWTDMVDFERRASKAKDIALLGDNLNWRDYKFNDLVDRERRIKAAARLKEAGVTKDWKSTTLVELQETEQRVTKARELKKLGRNVDWQKYSLSELIEMERQSKQP